MKFFVVTILAVIIGLIQLRSLQNVNSWYPMHDDTQIARVMAMGDALRDGQFPVRWVDSLGYGYGYPLFQFYSPLPYSVGGLIYSFGLSPIVATKLMILFGIILGIILFYLSFETIIGAFSATIGAVLFSFVPYHAVQLFVRGSIGEYWAGAFIAPVVVGCIDLLRGELRRSLLWLSIGMTGMVLSHTLYGFLAVIGCVFIGVIALLKGFIERKHVAKILLILGLIAGSLMWFIVPMISYMGYTNVASQVGGGATYSDHFVCLRQLWSSAWGFGGSVPGCDDGMSFVLGKIYIGLAGVSAVGMAMRRKIDRQLMLCCIGGLLAIVGVWLLLPISNSVWNVLKPLHYFQFPWRFLLVVTFGLVMMISVYINTLTKLWQRLMVVGVVAVIIVRGLAWFSPQTVVQLLPENVKRDVYMRYVYSKISDEYLPKDIPSPLNASDIIMSPIDTPECKEIERSSVLRKVSCITDDTLIRQLAVVMFPGVQVFVNGVKQMLPLQSMPVIEIPPGYSTVEVHFLPTWLHTSTLLISVISYVGVIYLIYGKKINS